MSETTIKAEDAPQERVEDTEQEQVGTDSQEAQEEPQEDGEGDGDGKPAKEAQKLRRRLREAEAERDAAQEAIGRLQSALVEQSLADSQVRPDALWAAGHSPAEFITENGAVDSDALQAAIKETATKFGIPTSNTPIPDPSQGAHSDTPIGNPWLRAFSASD